MSGCFAVTRKGCSEDDYWRRKDAVMVQIPSIADAIQRVVRAVLAPAEQVEAEAPSGRGLLTALRREFPQAMIVALSMTALLHAVHAAVQNQVEAAPDTAGPARE
jgi:hypothetical protein